MRKGIAPGLAPGAVLAAASGLVLGLMLVAGPAQAEGLKLSTRGQAAGLASKFAVLDGRAAKQYSSSDRLKPKREAESDGTVSRYAGRYNGPYLEMARAAARKHGIPEDLFLRLVQRESGFNAGAVSTKGAVGLAQLMPGTATLLAVDAQDPADNLDGGARYLKQLHARFGTWKLALAGYNAGPEAVEKYAGVPPYAETTAYVAAILGE